ncbi:MAG: phosphopantothenoylcysteine decarboxylase, partial [Thermoguttaceae bacterium]|nr:phosphopantothenoylcysteine decarboxylase [Thermoguttaceae bacterium]
VRLMPKEGNESVVGVMGVIAADKLAAVISRLAAAGAPVSVMMTEAASRLASPQTFYSLSGRPVRLSLWNDPATAHPHISVGKDAQILCVAPATADILAKAAAGIADDLLSTTILAFGGPILLAPSMNRVMWSKPVTQRNVARLKEDGFCFVGPESGRLSCGDLGSGRMAEPEEIFREIDRIVSAASSR